MFQFVTDNWAAIAATLAVVLLLIDKVVALTPSKKDDEFVAKVEAAFAVLGIKPAEVK